MLEALESGERGQRFLTERLRPHQQSFGYKAIWSHEFAFKTWVEDPAPIIEAVRGYLATDYDYPSNIKSVHDDLEKAKAEVMEGVEGDQRDQLQAALDRSLAMNPLTPDHHFYIDQGTNARLRLAVIAIGRKLAEAGVLADAEDVVFLRYNEVRLLLADQSALGDVQSSSPTAATTTRTTPSTARRRGWARRRRRRWRSRTRRCGASPRSSTPASRRLTGEVKGLAASPGVVEGTARYVTSVDQFDEVDEGDILVCRMTNPAWVVLFTKIHGLVTEAGGTMSHPAVVAREFGIPAVVGTTNAGDRIKTGDRIRVNGTTGVVELLA